MVLMSTMTFDQTFEAAVAISSTVMVLSAAWIVRVLIQIEKSKAVALSSVLQDDGTSGDLEFEESTTTATSKHLEVEPADAGAIEMSPTRSGRKGGPSGNVDAESATVASAAPSSPPTSKPVTARKARQRQKRISWMFINTQIGSVAVLVLLTYLLLVVSNAPIFLRMVGSLCVFGVFLRYQIGDEIRRQRIDRIMLLLSLFLLIASMLSVIVYSMKTLSQGEIYEGPARIVGYDMEQYNNSQHDPTTRTDIAVSWGKDWGCPMSGGKVCQSRIEGAMCQSHPTTDQTKHKSNNGNSRRNRRELEEDALEEDLEDEEKSNQDLEDENESLSKENEALEKEVDELKAENELEDEENDSLVDEENSEIDEMADEYNEDIMVVEEEMYEDAQDFEDTEYEEEEEDLEDEIESATDDDTKEDLTESLEVDEEEQTEVDEEYEEDEELLDEYADEYADAADEAYEEFEDEADTTYSLEDQKDEKEEEVEGTEAEINDNKSSSSSSSSSSSNGNNDDVYDQMAEEEEEEVEEEYEEEVYEEEDDWYWDEYPENYDDDSYEDDYWDYDWDSVWGDYACEDLFDSDIGGQTYDPNTPAGGDDEWPFVNVYGSCKTCEAYILDYFAEEAFEETQEFKQQAIVYLAGALAAFVWSLLSYIKYRVLPTAENEISLMGSDGGVMA